TNNSTFANLSFHRLFGLPITIVYAALVSLVIWLMLRWTVFGRNAQAVGSNPTAARFAGLGLGRVRAGVFAVMGLCAGVAAILLSSTNSGFSPDVGSGLLVPPFVATFFGLSVRAAGRFNVFGTVIGTLFIATLQTGLNMMGASAWLAYVVVGVALVVILSLATERSGRR
ncbi:MAG: ABC transporter permease, partial [Candidatus Xenobia bacterium]